MKIIRNIELNITKPAKRKSSEQGDFLADRVVDVEPEVVTPDEEHVCNHQEDILKAVALLTLINGVVVIGTVLTIDYVRKH